jgi:hypothetical protein
MGKRSPQKAQLQEVQRLTNLYAQSRVLPGIIPLTAMAIGVALLFGLVRVLDAVEEPVWLGIAILLISAVLFVWLTYRATVRYGPWFYRREGQVVLRSEGIPLWAYAFFFVTLGVVGVMEVVGALPLRWALAAELTCFGVFVFYVCKREKEMPTGIVFACLLLVAAMATAIGLSPPLQEWAWLTYFAGAWVITMILVHAYNRRVLRRLKGANPLGPQR